MSGKLRPRNEGACFLRVIAGMAIVLLHTMNVSEILGKEHITASQDRLSMLVVYCLMWAVPVFVMVSGALLLDPSRETGLEKIFRVYVFRVVLVLFASVLLFSLVDLIAGGEAFGPAFILDTLYRFFSGGSWSHLWYLYMLVGLYLLLPAYRFVAERCDEKLMAYLCILGAVFLSLCPLLEAFGIKSAFALQISGIYTLYFFLGYGIASGKLKLSHEWGLMFLVIGTVVTILLAVLGWRTGQASVDAVLQSYASPGVLLQSVGIFLLCWQREPGEKEHPILQHLDSLGLGIYLLHMIPLRLILRYRGFDPYGEGIHAFVILAAGSYAFAALLTAILRRIPAVRKVL